jgi:pimeloyl-ACP methyl ester carboxylesterase
VTDASQIVFSRAAAFGGVELHCASAGTSEGPLVFLLHGFPEFWYGWRHQITPLAAAGYRVIAPDQRGYNLSDKPRDPAVYGLDTLAADILALADGFGLEKFSVVGHDWGAAVAWWLATRYPERLDRLVALNAPHPAVWLAAQRLIPAQRRKSWYARFFRLPWLPEQLLRARRFDALARALRQAARPGAFSESDLARYRQAWSVPGALTGMLNWYRGAIPRDFGPPERYRITVPTLVLWGAREVYAVRETAEQSIRMCAGGELVFFEQATHWVQHDEPERVNRMLLDFLP